MRAVVLGVVLALGLGFFAFAAVVLYLAAGLSTTTSSAQPPSRPAPVTPSPATSPVEPSPAPTPTETNQPTTDPDSYDPPPLPRPKDLAEADRWLRANAIYQQKTARVDCAISRLKDSTPPKKLSTLDRYLARTMECLTKVWVKPAATAGFTVVQPPATSYDRPITTACGTSPDLNYAAAFYCSGDQRIYYGVNRDRKLFQRTPLEVDAVLAHEFGHVLQGRTGIFSARSRISRSLESQAEVLEYTRRNELQADCLAGLALNSLAKATGLTKAEREALQRDRAGRGDRDDQPRTHGAPESRRQWFSAGLDDNQIGACNTYAAGTKEVS